MRALVPVAALLAAAVVAVPATARPASVPVKVDDNYYVRSTGVPTVTVQRGDVVRWRFVGRSPHTVSSARGPVRIESGPRTSGTFTRRMTRAGGYRIVCRVHGPRMAMNLVVR